jgi:hypothetical protein
MHQVGVQSHAVQVLVPVFHVFGPLTCMQGISAATIVGFAVVRLVLQRFDSWHEQQASQQAPHQLVRAVAHASRTRAPVVVTHIDNHGST